MLTDYLIAHLHQIQYLCFILAQLNNIALLSLIWLKASVKYGSYRYIMAIFSLYSLVYAWVEIAVLPMMHTKVPVFAIMVNSSLKHHTYLGRFIISIYCGSFALCISLLAAQFVYRYLVVCRPHFSLSGYKYLNILVPCPIAFVTWFLLVYYGMESDTSKLAPSFRLDVLETYHDDLDSIGFSALVYWYTDEAGVERWNRDSLISIAGMDAIIASCFSVILYCGFSIYRDLQTKQNLMSQRKIDLQKQLFYTLAFQTLLPFFLMYMTVGLIITTPLLSLDIGKFANIAGVTVAIYPSLEPCIAIMCIKDFRKALMFWKSPVTPASWMSDSNRASAAY